MGVSMAIETHIDRTSLRWGIAINGTRIRFLPSYSTEAEAEAAYQIAHPGVLIITTENPAHSCHKVSEAA